MDIVEESRKFVETECKKPSSKYGNDPYVFHFVPMVKYANELARKLGGDIEVINLAAWLHDIGSIIDGRENHHVTGAEIAAKFLKSYNYPADKINLIKKCISNHRGSMNEEKHSIEEQIIAEADAISNFDNIAGIFQAAYVYEKLDQADARKSVKKKLQNKYDQLRLKESRELVKPKYEAAMMLLG